MFQNPKVTQGQAFHLGFSCAVKLELSQRFCLSSLDELPSARGQSILKGFGLGECQIFPALFILLSLQLIPAALRCWSGRKKFPICLFYYKEPFFFSSFSCPFLFFPFFSFSFFFSSFPCENLSERLVPQRIVEGDPQWILSKEKNSSDLSPENAGTTERGLDISWEEEFLTKEPKPPEENPRGSFGKWSCAFGQTAGVLGAGFDQGFAFSSLFPGTVGEQGAVAAPQELPRVGVWNLFGNTWISDSFKTELWDGIIPISSPPSSRDPVCLQPRGFFYWRATAGAEGASSKWNKIKLGGKLGFGSTKFQSLVCSALSALLLFCPFISFLFWHSQSHLLTALCTLRAQQRILDHPNKSWKLSPETGIASAVLGASYSWFSTCSCCSLFQKWSGKGNFNREKLEGNPSMKW